MPSEQNTTLLPALAAKVGRRASLLTPFELVEQSLVLSYLLDSWLPEMTSYGDLELFETYKIPLANLASR